MCAKAIGQALRVRRRQVCAIAALTIAALGGIGAAAGGPATSGAILTGRTRHVALSAQIDGLIIRGRWHAKITLGAPRLSYSASGSDGHAVLTTRTATTLTIVRTRADASGPVPEICVRVPRLRGVAASGPIDLTIEDRSDAPLFLDLSGTGTVRATGAVPLLRVTTSGNVRADLTALLATVARVHARQHSRLAIRARDALTIVALDSARVSYAAKVVHLSARGAAMLAPL